MSDYQQQEMEHERFRIIEGLLREIVANTAPAQPRPKLPKVREALEHMRLVSRNSFGLDLSRAGIAELDAVEKGE